MSETHLSITWCEDGNHCNKKTLNPFSWGARSEHPHLGLLFFKIISDLKSILCYQVRKRPIFNIHFHWCHLHFLLSGWFLGQSQARDTMFEGNPVSQLTTDSVATTVSRTALGVNPGIGTVPRILFTGGSNPGFEVWEAWRVGEAASGS